MGLSNYAGWLVKIGASPTSQLVTLPFWGIRFNSYSATYQPIDVTAYEDGNGELHRNTLSRRKLKVEWRTPEMSDEQMQTLLKLFRDRMTAGENAKQQKVYVEAWCPYLNKYVKDYCYLSSDLVFSIKSANASGIVYGETRIALIGYTTSTATM